MFVFCDAVMKNTSLTILDLHGNDLSDDTYKVLGIKRLHVAQQFRDMGF